MYLYIFVKENKIHICGFFFLYEKNINSKKDIKLIMGRTAVNFTFDIPDIDITKTPRSSIACVSDSDGLLDEGVTSTRMGVFQYETNEYIVPAGKRLIFRVSLNLSPLHYLYTLTDSNHSNYNSNNFWFELPQFAQTFCQINKIFNFGFIPDMVAFISENLDSRRQLTSSTLIAAPNQKIKLIFDWPSRDDMIRYTMNQSDGLQNYSTSTVNRILEKGFVKCSRYAFDTQHSVQQAQGLNQPGSAVTVVSNSMMMTNSIFRFGTPEIAFLNGFLEDDI